VGPGSGGRACTLGVYTEVVEVEVNSSSKAVQWNSVMSDDEFHVHCVTERVEWRHEDLEHASLPITAVATTRTMTTMVGVT
jgi:hypothetical protein